MPPGLNTICALSRLGRSHNYAVLPHPLRDTQGPALVNTFFLLLLGSLYLDVRGGNAHPLELLGNLVVELALHRDLQILLLLSSHGRHPVARALGVVMLMCRATGVEQVVFRVRKDSFGLLGAVMWPPAHGNTRHLAAGGFNA